jgi:membrane dipeptidase
MESKLMEQVADIHSRAFTVDAHFDLPYEVANRRERGAEKVIETSYMEQFRRGSVDLLVSAIFIHDFFLPEMGLRKALDQISYLLEEIEETPGQFRICRTTAEAYAARSSGETALFLSLEGADPLQNDIQLLRIFYELGVRGLGLVWSRRNYAGDGAFFVKTREGRKGGLTPFGVKLIEQAERFGMFVDVSHINDEGFWDVMDVASQPVIASHSNCRALSGTMRNLDDEQIKAIAKNGGVIGMNSINLFIRDDEPEVTVSHFIDHVDHIARVGGIEHVGLGFDLCESFKDFLQVEKPLDTNDVIKTHAELGEFTAGLITRGYTDEEIIAVLGGNFMRVFSEILD